MDQHSLPSEAKRQRSSGNERRTTVNHASKLLPQEDIEQALCELETAFALIGCVAGNSFACPVCGEQRRGKVVLRPTKRYWKCYVCGTYPDDPRYLNAIELVQNRCSVPFPKAVNILLGRNDGPVPAAKVAELVANARVDDGFSAATEDWVWELYTSVVDSPHVSSERAAAYYAARHIDAVSVAKMRFGYITDPEALRVDLLAEFGADKLVASGLAVDGDKGLRLLCGWNYPVVEPAIDHKGRVRNLQFRPSERQKAKIIAHKRGDGPYVPPFMSIKGAGPRHLIGIGLHLLADGPGRTVMVVEGAADAAAAYTLGAQGVYAMPGTNVLPPAGVVRFLAQRGHRVVVALDGDDAGTKARPVVAEHFRVNGYAEEAGDRLGFDVAALVSKDLAAAVEASGEAGSGLVAELAGELGINTDSVFDSAPDQLRDRLRSLYLASCRVKEKTDMPDGMDVCDILIARHVQDGCPCNTCVQRRAAAGG
jgi:hypothetical protein